MKQADQIFGRKTAGFTLVEMAVVILILGIMIGGVASAYTLYQKHLEIEKTETNISDLSDAIGSFRSLHGRYPCPASLTATRDELNYGREDCNAMITSSVGTPEDNNGIGIQESIRDGTFLYQRPNNDGTKFTGTFTELDNDTAPMRVAIGGIPFRNLNMEEQQAYDGYDNRIVYAVTEHLAFADAFQVSGGGIELLDEEGTTSALGENPEDLGTAHFVIFSPGKNEFGAYSQAGTRYDCPATGIDNENCDYDDAVFRVARASAGDADSNNDDVISYFTQKEVPLWQLSEAADHGSDVHAKSSGLIGFGVDPDSISEEASINNTLRVADDPDTDDLEGQIQTEELCTFSSDEEECFKSELIGGALDSGGGMKCPDGQFMAGIANSGPICRDEVIVKCPAGSFMTGIGDNGAPLCDDAPPDGCGVIDVQLCSETVSVGPGKHGSTYTATAGDSRKQVYKCDAGTWKKHGNPTGLCDCNPGPGNPQNINCSNITAGSCARPYSGTKIQTVTTHCPGGATTTNVTQDCLCTDTSKPGSQNCPSGFNEGKKYGTYDFSCTTKQCKFTVNNNACRCVPDDKTQQVNCPGNYSGKYTEIKYFKCPNGEKSPGVWDKNWQQKPGEGIAEKCTCKEHDLSPTTQSCPDGYEGNIETPRQVTCPGGVPTVVLGTPINNCNPIPEPKCKWVPLGGQIGDGSSANQAYHPCECGSSSAICSTGGKRYNCACK